MVLHDILLDTDPEVIGNICVSIRDSFELSEPLMISMIDGLLMTLKAFDLNDLCRMNMLSRIILLLVNKKGLSLLTRELSDALNDAIMVANIDNFDIDKSEFTPLPSLIVCIY